MPPVKASADELQNLIAYLSSLTGVHSGAPTISRNSPEGGIDFSRILNPKPGDWLTYNGNLSGNRYSPLKQINVAQREQTDACAGPSRFRCGRSSFPTRPITTRTCATSDWRQFRW